MHYIQRHADAGTESDCGIHAGWPALDGAIGALAAIRAGRFATGQAYAGPGRETVHHHREYGVRRVYRSLGFQARVRQLASMEFDSPSLQRPKDHGLSWALQRLRGNPSG